MNNLRTDLLTINGTGSYTNTISKAFKDLRFVGQLTNSDFDSCYIGMGKEDVKVLPDNYKECSLSVHGLIYFHIGIDTQNAGTLETKCETIIEDLYKLNETWTNAVQSLDANSKRAIELIEIVGVQPYLNTGFPDRGELEFELKIIYYRS